MADQKSEKWLLLGTGLAYFLIGLEVLFMITPFALYFYGVYGPILEFLSSHRLTAWTVEFFMPHMVFVEDPLLNGLSYLQTLFVVGMVLFFLAAAPLYYGRLTGKGVVSFGFYARVRHPQYLFLAISGFGLLLYWPRFIVLIFFVTMLFVYYLLARNEEWRMRREQGGSYEEYMARSWMFLPGEPGGAVYRVLFGFIRPRWLGLLATYLLVMVLSVGAALGIRAHTIERLPRAAVDSMTLVSVYPRPAAELQGLYAGALASPEVQEYLGQDQLNLAYLMPGDFFLTGLILKEGPRFSEHQLKRYPALRELQKNPHSGGLVKFFRLGYKFFQTIGTTRRVYDVDRIVFVHSRNLDGEAVLSEQVFDIGVKKTPALVVDIDSETREVLSVFRVSGSNVWGQLPMPTF
ncbi:MAG: hypothetical protein C0617_02170 [Desulfuromonas sp.]|uniref:methyltransferase family protein n=1 Tax=Desulfuromonas sp. TaxID=892 RepID=UPI000CAFBB17|nr:isoprenylcysteine carboxylmethyltransferase family protein [Desulfuromonas sp.]PLX86107.1 MAG: hypothetical protein C0617_02170 [Desulfuromonas sp.]